MFQENSLPIAWRPLHVSIVTETYPPEINGVTHTVARWIEGLRRRGHRVDLVCVRQKASTDAEPGNSPDNLYLLGFRIPRYPQLQAGWPDRGALLARWRGVAFKLRKIAFQR